MKLTKIIILIIMSILIKGLIVTLTLMSVRHTHTESLWIVVEKPTCIKEGKKEIICTTCSEVLREESINKLPHNYIEGICDVCKDEDMEYINNIDYSKKLQYKLNEDQKSYSVIGVNGYKYKKLIIPSTYNDLPVTTIGEKAFYQYINLEIVEMSNNVMMIDKYAFSGCLNMTDIIFSKNLVEIGDYAFYNCYELTDIVLPDGVIKIGDNVFNSCVNLKSIVLPDSIINMGKRIFRGCGDLVIYCEAPSRPSGWEKDWNYYNYRVVWGYTKK